MTRLILKAVFIIFPYSGNADKKLEQTLLETCSKKIGNAETFWIAVFQRLA